MTTAHIWGQQYNRSLLDIFAIQEEIAKDITEKLRLRLSKDEKQKLARRQTNNTEAYQFI